MANKRFTLSRRAVLRGLAGVTIGLPFLGAMEKPARADKFPKRLIIMFSPNGTIPSAWAPQGTETDFKMGSILEPLEPLKSDVIVIQGVDNEAANHGPGDGHQTGIGTLLTGTELLPGDTKGGCDSCPPAGFAGGPSVDQVIAASVGKTTKLASMEFGVHVHDSDDWSRISYLGANQPVPPEDNPRSAFNRLFSDLNTDPNGLKQLRAERHTVLDAVMDDYQKLNAKLGAEDRMKLDAHVTAIRSIEQRLDVGGQLGGSCALPMITDPGDIYDDKHLPAVGKLQMDLLVMALACDLTRVTTLQWTRGVGDVVFSWLGISEGHHSLSHHGDDDTAAKDQLIKINNWYAQQFAYLMTQLKKIPEGDGTLLDNTALLWVNDLGVGNSHTRENIPFVLAGSCGGYFKTGRYLQYDKDWHNGLLLSLCHAMDVNLTSFGNPAYCKGPLPRLTG